MAFDPDAYLQSKTQEQSSEGFDPDQYLKSKQEPVSELESAGRGALQGTTFGFADEAAGGVEALWEKAKGNPTAFGELYKKHRDESRANFKKAEQDNPNSYLAGEVAGSIATAAIPFGSTATLAKAAKTGARIGALSSLGQSEAEDASGTIKDVFTGAGMGAAGGLAGRALESGYKAARGGVDRLLNKGAQEAVETASNVLSKESGSVPIEEPSVFKEAAQSAKNRLKSYFNPDVDPSFEEFADIAKKNGIDTSLLPESVKFGPDSSASRAARNLAEGKFGEETLKRFNQTLDQVRDAYDRKITKFSGGLPVDEITAGKVLRDSYDEGVSKFFDQMDFTHNSIINMAPGLSLTDDAFNKIQSSLNGIEKFAKGRLERGVTATQRGQGEQLLNAVSAIRNGNGSYKQTVEALRDIGEAAFQSKNSLADVPVDVQRMRKLYNDVNESLLETVRTRLGDDIADSLIANNKAMTEFFGDQSLISRVMGDKTIAPENAFKTLIMNGDSQRIEALKKILPPEKWEYLKGAVLENIVKRDPEGGFAFKSLYNNMRNKRSALSSIFTPDELAENAGLVRLGDRFGNPVLSSSGTGASISFGDLTKSATNLTVDSIALRNANKAASKALDQAPKTPTKIRDVSPQLKSLPARTASAALAMPSSANKDASTEKKGPEKWVNDGARVLLENGVSSKDIESLKQTKQGRNLLIEASDAKPGSVRMDGVLKKIRTAQGGQ